MFAPPVEQQVDDHGLDSVRGIRYCNRHQIFQEEGCSTVQEEGRSTVEGKDCGHKMGRASREG
jgi:hypothetical protein